jgi:hypothetical protein
VGYMIFIEEPITLEQLSQQVQSGFSDLIKIVVDIENEIIAADAELHADLEELLLSKGSEQAYLWGVNLYPKKSADDFIEYTAFINIRPSMNNRSMEIEDAEIKLKVKKIVSNLIVV